MSVAVVEPERLGGIYFDEQGRQIETQSMLKTFLLCPMQTNYKYVQRLKPKVMGKPLRQGDWMHHLMETQCKGGDWRETHKLYVSKFNKLFDEERDNVGDLPTECARLMRSYLWHYESDPWTILEVEFMVEVEMPDGSILRAKFDLLVENQWGIWIVDHKWNRKLPNLTQRMLDVQSPLYVWAARRMGIPAKGFIWNYCRRKAPSIPKLITSEKKPRLSRAACDTDYPTLLKSIKSYGLDWKDYKPWLRQLKGQRYMPGEPQMSTFFRRDHIERSDQQLMNIARTGLHTAKRMHAYPFDKPELIERHTGGHCDFRCSYTDICTLELFGNDTSQLRRQRYEQVDPMYYYFDDPKEEVLQGVE